jgi:hypothetical protein
MLFPVVFLGNETALMGGILHGWEWENAAVLDECYYVVGLAEFGGGSTAFHLTVCIIRKACLGYS